MEKIDLRTHRILKADYGSEGEEREFPIEILYLQCCFEIGLLVGTKDSPGTQDGIVYSWKELGFTR